MAEFGEPAPVSSPETPRSAPQHRLERTRTSRFWTTIVAIIVVLVVLIVFIVQNTQQVHIDFFTASGSLPLGVAMLLTAVAGAMIAALSAGIRILQLRRIAKRHAAENSYFSAGEDQSTSVSIPKVD